jgi:4,5-DOPA dioxygenase extradiol
MSNSRPQKIGRGATKGYPMSDRKSRNKAGGAKDGDLMPVVFVGHGNPMNAIEDNVYARAWARLGQELPRPRTILSVSAHWEVGGSLVSTQADPQTIHDFYGFPEELYAVRYPCPGSPRLAEKIIELGRGEIAPDDSWGIDHGTWSVLRRMYPRADIPVVQLSLDYGKSPRRHFEAARMLAPLRKEGVLIVGSGNLVHNLRLMRYSENAAPYDWAIEFDRTVAGLIGERRYESLVEYGNLGGAATLSIPTNEHYLPLLYVLALAQQGEQVSFPVTGIDLGSVSMRAVRIG